jgi:hypothetical protein
VLHVVHGLEEKAVAISSRPSTSFTWIVSMFCGFDRRKLTTILFVQSRSVFVSECDVVGIVSSEASIRRRARAHAVVPYYYYYLFIDKPPTAPVVVQGSSLHCPLEKSKALPAPADESAMPKPNCPSSCAGAISVISSSSSTPK